MGKSFIITLLLIAGKVRPWKDYVCYTSVFEQRDMDILGNGFMITVTNIEIFSDHLVNYENVDVIVVVTVVGIVGVQDFLTLLGKPAQ